MKQLLNYFLFSTRKSKIFTLTQFGSACSMISLTAFLLVCSYLSAVIHAAQHVPKRRPPSVKGCLSKPGLPCTKLSTKEFPNFSHSDDFPRPPWAKPIVIETNKKLHYKLSGTVIPIFVDNRVSTVGPTPSKSFNGAKCGNSSGYERGHVLGLRLGGPNHWVNIAAQTAGWQGGGGEWYDTVTFI